MNNRTMRFVFQLVLCGLLACLTCYQAYAASFDCEKAITLVEKIICSSSNIEDIDDKLTVIYSKAVTNNVEQQANLIKRQKQWLQQVRNRCKDVVCLKETYLARINELKTSFNIPTDRYEITGVWFSDGGAESTFGNIVITDHSISWGGKGHGNPFCKTKYSIEKEPVGISFKDQHKHIYIYNENSNFKTYKIKVPSLAHDCPGNTPITHFRFTLPLYNLDYANVIEYESSDPGCLPDWLDAGTGLCISRYMRFGRLKD